MWWDNSGSIEKFGGCGGRRGVGRSRSRSKGVLKHFVADRGKAVFNWWFEAKDKIRNREDRRIRKGNLAGKGNRKEVVLISLE